MHTSTFSGHILALALITVASTSACNVFTDPDEVKSRAEAARDSGEACEAPRLVCDGACIDPSTNVDHCGGCDPCPTVIAAEATCDGGTCVYTCVESAEDRNNDIAMGPDGDGCECNPATPCVTSCGDDTCEGTELGTCCQDCSCGQDQVCNTDTGVCDPRPIVCEDEVCDPSEAATCCQDCGCDGEQVCNTANGLCTDPPVCGNGICDVGEQPETCCRDCGCGDETAFVCPAEGMACNLGQWRFVATYFENTPDILLTARGEMLFGESGLYSVPFGTLDVSDVRAFISGGQIIMNEDRSLFAVDGQPRTMDGQLDLSGDLAALADRTTPYTMFMIRQQPDPALSDLEGRFELVGMAVTQDITPEVTTPQSITGSLSFDGAGCLIGANSALTVGALEVSLTESCAVIEGSDVVLTLTATEDALPAPLVLRGSLTGDGEVMLATHWEGEDLGAGTFVAVRVPETTDTFGGSFYVDELQIGPLGRFARRGKVDMTDEAIRNSILAQSDGGGTELDGGSVARGGTRGQIVITLDEGLTTRIRAIGQLNPSSSVMAVRSIDPEGDDLPALGLWILQSCDPEGAPDTDAADCTRTLP